MLSQETAAMFLFSVSLTAILGSLLIGFFYQKAVNGLFFVVDGWNGLRHDVQ